MSWRPGKVVSGGQTGADQGGVIAAKLCGISTGGWAPRGFRTEDGPAPWLGLEYGLREHASPSYSDRTYDNVRDSDATFILGGPSAGSKLTETICVKKLHKQCLWLLPWTAEDELAEKLAVWLNANKPRVLNVAGNRESVYPGIGERMRTILNMLWLPR